MADKAPPPKPLFQQIMEDAKLGRDPEHKAHALDMLNEFITQATAAAATAGKESVPFIQKRINEMDQQLSKQLDVLLHNEKLHPHKNDTDGHISKNYSPYSLPKVPKTIGLQDNFST